MDLIEERVAEEEEIDEEEVAKAEAEALFKKKGEEKKDTK